MVGRFCGIMLRGKSMEVHMKKYELDAIETNIIKTLVTNPIGRNSEVFDFLRLLDNIEGSAKISLDANWGDGKTFFVKQSALLLNYLRESSFERVPSSDNNDVLTGLIDGNQISMDKTFIPIYYDAWLFDDHPNPILSLMYNLIINGYVSDDLTKKKNLLNKAMIISENFMKLMGVDINIEELFNMSDELDEVYSIEKTKTLLKDILDEIINENCDKLLVIIDELDRCRPSYAIKLLERIKHFFDDDRVIFIFATNKAQLVHTVKSFYGAEFNASTYLNRFFEFQFSLEKINVDSYFDFIDISRNSALASQNIAIDIGNYYKFSMREFNIYYSKLKSVEPLSITRGTSFCYNILAPIAWALSIVDIEKEREFTSGRLISELQEVLSNVPSMKEFAIRWGGYDEMDIILENIDKLYKYMFTTSSNDAYYKGNFDISIYDRKKILNRIRMA
jgi:hypothetical protein